MLNSSPRIRHHLLRLQSLPQCNIPQPLFTTKSLRVARSLVNSALPPPSSRNHRFLSSHRKLQPIIPRMTTPSYSTSHVPGGPSSEPPKPTAPITPIHKLTSRPILTAGILIIGDEILSSKTRDTNSSYFAKFCFENGIDLLRIEVVPDDYDEIIESVQRLSRKCDFVVTSGGIGPTHDDITYEAIGRAFGLSVGRHSGAVERMKKLARGKDGKAVKWSGGTAEEQEARRNRLRMAEFPFDKEDTPEAEKLVKVVFPKEDLWVPVVGVKNVYTLPGVPLLFQGLLTAILPYLHLDPNNKLRRIQILTPLPESEVAAFLRAIQDSLTASGSSIKIGSYPRWKQEWNTVTLLGRTGEDIEGVAATVCEGVRGVRVGADATEEEILKIEREKREKEGIGRDEAVGGTMG